MYRWVWLLILLPLAACGGKSPADSLAVTCDGGTQLYGAASVDVQADPANGHATLSFPDPTNPGKTGAIAVPPGGHCRIGPQKNNT